MLVYIINIYIYNIYSSYIVDIYCSFYTLLNFIQLSWLFKYNNLGDCNICRKIHDNNHTKDGRGINGMVLLKVYNIICDALRIHMVMHTKLLKNKKREEAQLGGKWSGDG